MKILIEESVLRQALEALEYNQCNWKGKPEAITALRSALDAAEQVEPVAWMDEDGAVSAIMRGYRIPLYAAPTPPTNTDSELSVYKSRYEHWFKKATTARGELLELRAAAQAVVDEWLEFHDAKTLTVERLREALK